MTKTIYQTASKRDLSTRFFQSIDHFVCGTAVLLPELSTEVTEAQEILCLNSDRFYLVEKDPNTYSRMRLRNRDCKTYKGNLSDGLRWLKTFHQSTISVMHADFMGQFNLESYLCAMNTTGMLNEYGATLRFTHAQPGLRGHRPSNVSAVLAGLLDMFPDANNYVRDLVMLVESPSFLTWATLMQAHATEGWSINAGHVERYTANVYPMETCWFTFKPTKRSFSNQIDMVLDLVKGL
jgi:hypothetical protein